MSDSIPATAEPNPSEPRPRLAHTVTLGEIDFAASRAEAPASRSGAAVVVNNYTQVNVVTPSYGYGNYGYFRSAPGFSPVAAPVAPARFGVSGPQPGQDWPAVADHGPTFPYSSAPASPWPRTR